MHQEPQNKPFSTGEIIVRMPSTKIKSVSKSKANFDNCNKIMQTSFFPKTGKLFESETVAVDK